MYENAQLYVSSRCPLRIYAQVGTQSYNSSNNAQKTQKKVSFKSFTTSTKPKRQTYSITIPTFSQDQEETPSLKQIGSKQL